MVEMLYSAKDVAKILQVHPTTVRMWMRAGWIPVLRLAPHVQRITQSTLDRLLAGEYSADQPLDREKTE